MSFIRKLKLTTVIQVSPKPAASRVSSSKHGTFLDRCFRIHWLVSMSAPITIALRALSRQSWNISG